MFSPTLAMVSATVMLPARAARILFTSEPAPSATSAIIFTRPWNRSLRATKSVSELTSTRIPLLGVTATPISPSARARPAFFAALDRPFLGGQSTAASRLPPLSLSAALQSIMPAPVWSRSSFTMDALTVVVILAVLVLVPAGRADWSATRFEAVARPLHFLGRQFLGLGDPALDAAGKPNLLAD